MAEEILQPDQTPQGKKEEEKTSFKQDLYYWTQALIVVLVGLILVCTLAGRVIRVVGSSMVPTLHENDLLLLWWATPPSGGTWWCCGRRASCPTLWSSGSSPPAEST